MEFLEQIVDLFLHLDKHLNEVAGSLGPWLYVILFAIIFAETGFVVTPFLPGDSLLFAVGALAATVDSPITLLVLLPLLIFAAVAGDAVNYWIGYLVGPRVFQRESSWLLNKKHLLRAQQFYERYGGPTIVFARFVPIVRTFAPFVAGVGRMSYRRFWMFNVCGGIAWVTLFLVAGFLFGGIPLVRDNFGLVAIGIIFVSVLPILVPIVFDLVRARRQQAEAAPVVQETPVVETLRESA